MNVAGKENPVRGVLKTTFVVASFLFMGLSAWKLTKQVDRFPDMPNYAALVASITLVWAGFVSAICVWKYLLSSYGESIRFPQAYRIYFQANLGKYLPGKVWQLASMVFLCREIDIRPGKSLPASLYNQAAAMLAGLVLLGAVLPTVSGDAGEGFLWYIVTAAGLFLFVAFPDFLTWGMNRGLRLLGKEEIDERIDRKTVLGSLVGYIFSWCVFGLAFHTLIRFLGLRGNISFLEATGIFSGSVSIGFLAFFSPGGIGIREGIMAFFLKDAFPVSTALYISLVARLWITAVELLAFFSTYIAPWAPGKTAGSRN